MADSNLDRNGCARTLTAKYLRGLSLAKTEGQGRMWTTGQFSKLTGVSKRTLQNWSQEPDCRRSKTKPNPITGAMLAAASQNPENGYRTYDIHSLFEVAMIRLGQDSGLSQSMLRSITRSTTDDALATILDHIDNLVGQRAEIDRKIKLARLVIARCSNGKEREHSGESTEFGLAGLIIEELLDCLAQADGAALLDADAGFSFQAAKASFAGLVGVWAHGHRPDSIDAQTALTAWHGEIARLFKGLSRTSFAHCIEEWLSHGYSPILLTLHFGEGVVEWLIGASNAFPHQI